MKLLSSVFYLTFLGTFSQSLLFSNGIGVDLALRIGKWPISKWAVAGLITFFSLMTVPEMALIRLLNWPEIWTIPLLVFAECVVCLAILGVLWWALRPKNRRLHAILQNILPMAAFNSLVILVGISAQWRSFTVAESIGYAFGTGISFLLVRTVLEESVRRIGNEEMPEAFEGLPSLLIYFGILSMAILGFGGAPLLFV